MADGPVDLRSEMRQRVKTSARATDGAMGGGPELITDRGCDLPLSWARMVWPGRIVVRVE